MISITVHCNSLMDECGKAEFVKYWLQEDGKEWSNGCGIDHKQSSFYFSYCCWKDEKGTHLRSEKKNEAS